MCKVGCLSLIHYICPQVELSSPAAENSSDVSVAGSGYRPAVPASEPRLCLLKVVLEKQVQGSHAVLQSQRQV